MRLLSRPGSTLARFGFPRRLLPRGSTALAPLRAVSSLYEPPHPHRHQTGSPPPSSHQRDRPASEGRHQRPRCRQHHLRQRNGEAGLGGRRCRKPLDSLRRPAELRQDHASGRRLGTWPGTHLRGPALPVRLSKRSSPGLRVQLQPNRAAPSEAAGGRHQHRGGQSRRKGDAVAGHDLGRNAASRSRPRATTSPWNWTKTAAICSRRRFPNLPWMPMLAIGFSPSPARLPTSTGANGSSPGMSAKQSITGRWGDSFPDKEARRQCLLGGLARQLRSL